MTSFVRLLGYSTPCARYSRRPHPPRSRGFKASRLACARKPSRPSALSSTKPSPRARPASTPALAAPPPCAFFYWPSSPCRRWPVPHPPRPSMIRSPARRFPNSVSSLPPTRPRSRLPRPTTPTRKRGPAHRATTPPAATPRSPRSPARTSETLPPLGRFAPATAHQISNARPSSSTACSTPRLPAVPSSPSTPPPAASSGVAP